MSVDPAWTAWQGDIRPRFEVFTVALLEIQVLLESYAASTANSDISKERSAFALGVLGYFAALQTCILSLDNADDGGNCKYNLSS